MALANKQNESAMAIIQASAFYDQDFGGPSLLHTSSNSSPEDHVYGPRPVYGEPESPAKNFTMSNSPTVSSPSSTNSNGGLGFHHANYTTTHVSEEGNSVITFNPEFGNFAGSLLSFDQAAKRAVRRNLDPRMMAQEDDQFPMWEGDYLNVKPPAAAVHGPPETSNASAVEYESPSGGAPWAWLNDHDGSGSGVTNGGGEEMEAADNKRPSTVKFLFWNVPVSIIFQNRKYWNLFFTYNKFISFFLKTLADLNLTGICDRREEYKIISVFIWSEKKKKRKINFEFGFCF